MTIKILNFIVRPYYLFTYFKNLENLLALCVKDD